VKDRIWRSGGSFYLQDSYQSHYDLRNSTIFNFLSIALPHLVLVQNRISGTLNTINPARQEGIKNNTFIIVLSIVLVFLNYDTKIL
jgi:hypothetical protein